MFFMLSFQGCSGLYKTIEDPVEWWAVNSYGNAVTIEFYDNNCHHPLRDVHFKAHEELRVISCGDGKGLANIRFRREGYPSRSDPWGADAILEANQRVFVR